MKKMNWAITQQFKGEIEGVEITCEETFDTILRILGHVEENYVIDREMVQALKEDIDNTPSGIWEDINVEEDTPFVYPANDEEYEIERNYESIFNGLIRKRIQDGTLKENI